jgi:hypothetical protein
MVAIKGRKCDKRLVAIKLKMLQEIFQETADIMHFDQRCVVIIKFINIVI